MPVIIATTIDEATAALAEHRDVTLLAGGTDAMVEVNDGHRRPAGPVLVLNRIPELRSWRHDPVAATLTIGACVTYTELMDGPPAELVPALAEASRTVGSPQIRNAGTLGGNVGTASPAGDGLPVLAALGATVTLASATGERTLPVTEFITGVKRTAIDPGELITELTLPVVGGWQGYTKVGVRNAMVIAVASACLVVDRERRDVRIALGSVGPTVLRCPDAEAFLGERIEWTAPTGFVAGPDDIERFGELVSAASRPITDHRSTADYRRHAVGVLARRLARRATGATGSAAA